MPQIVSLLPLAPAVSGPTPATPATQATPTASSGVTPPGALLPTDPTSPNFLAQFKSALKSLANVVVLPQLTQRPPIDQGSGPLMSPVMDLQPETPVVDSAKHAEGLMPELLVELGFTLVPAALPMPVTPKVVATNVLPTVAPPMSIPPETKAAPALALAQPPVRPAAQPAQAGQPLADTLPTAQVATPVADAKPPKTQPADTQIPPWQVAPSVPEQPLSNLYFRQSPSPDQTQPAPATPPLSAQPLPHLKPLDQPQSATPAVTAQPPVPTASALSAHQPTAAAPGAGGTLVPMIGIPHDASPRGSQSGTGSSDRGRHTRDTRVASIASEGASVQAAPVSDAAMVAAAATSASADVGPQSAPIEPGQVVSQIANHADLIRLPGNKGLHIQLHPEDLGGVQVTVRYSAGGGVELHISADHAATGALVQAGWTELRDTLATHGISADRLMMSVTSPTSAGQADLSGGAGSRPDPSSYSSNSSSSPGNLSTDSQGQGQSRQDNGQQRTAQSWRGGAEPVSSSDDSPRVVSTTAGPSRIDYRV